VVDFLCHEYGWRPETVFELTRNEIEALMKAAQERLEATYKAYAALTGAEIKEAAPKTPKEMLKQIKESGLAYEIVNG